MNARGIAAEELSDGCHRSSMEKLAGWTANSERVLVF
jgi:sulfur relay (sulfurtransferase) complex TusBCD TusD component (DsrE family)